MLKALYVDADVCAGCRRCELACAFMKNKAFNPRRAGVHVIAIEPGGIRVPIFCTQCGLCIDLCPLGALKRGKAGAVVVNAEKCDGCGICVTACPRGTIFIDPKTGKAIKCDLCLGEPACVKYCPQDALKYDDVNIAAYWRRKNEARGLSMTSLYRKLWKYRPKE